LDLTFASRVRGTVGGERQIRSTSPLLQVEGLTKRFGGIVVADALTFEIPAGECHAIIGPNGAGKTTLISLLAGEIAAREGAIIFDGSNIASLPPYRRSLIGIARSFQISSLFSDFTALDNVALALQAHSGHSFRFWRKARSDERLRKPALAALARVGLADRAHARVGRLSHGEHRQLEIAMALATKPRLLLLDEPMAGMGPEESAAMLKLLSELKRTLTIVLVEHDMEAVFALADRVTVMVHGRIIASGEPAAIRDDAEVRRAYLGEQKNTAARND
jgi:branched-chain amino acid transport system ATP-binding protein